MARIAIDGRYIQDHFPGIGRYTYNLIDALASFAPQHQWLILHNPALKNTRYVITELARHANVELHRLDVPTFSVAEQWKVGQIGRRLRCDLLHSPYYIKPYWLPFPSVVTVHDLISHLYPETLPGFKARILFEITTRLALATADAVITVSQSAANDLQRIYRVPGPKLAITQEAADPRYHPLASSETASVVEPYSLPQPYVFFLGSNKPHKNIGRMLEAWNQVNVSRYALVIAGHFDPRYPHPFSSGTVHWLGPVAEADLPALYQRAALFVFPSLYEGFGLPPLEAMACGVPVICSNRSSLPEVTGDAALAVDPLDTAALTAAIQTMLGDDALRAAYAQRSLAQATRFSWQTAARQTLAVYEQVLRRGAG